MVRAGFEGVVDRVGELFGEQRYAEAYQVLVNEASDFPDRVWDAYYLRSCAAARMGDGDLAVALIRDALDRGLWFGEFLLRRTPSWRTLQGTPAFEEVAAVNLRRQQAEALPAHHRTVLPDGVDAPYRAVVALHGNGQSAEQAAEGWRAVVAEGRLLAAVQSSHASGPGQGAVWDDEDTVLADVTGEFAALAAEHALDPRHTVVAGFSMGCEAALRLALLGALPVRGFVLMGPGGPRTPDPETWRPLLEAWQKDGSAPLRGYLMVGEYDVEVPAQTHRRLAEILTAHGIPCGFEVVPGSGHEYPADFLPFVRRALAFVDPEG